MSIGEQRAMLDNYNKVKAEQEKERGAKKEQPKKRTLNFRPVLPKPRKTPFCAYCKTEGHWMKNREEIICPKLKAKNDRANQRRREIERKWRNDVSKEVEKETGVGGWEPVGPIGSISLWPRKILGAQGCGVGGKKLVKASKNPFDMGGEDDDVSEEEVVEEEVCLSGAWAKPLKVEEVAEEKEVVESVGLTEYDPNLSWGDQF